MATISGTELPMIRMQRDLTIPHRIQAIAKRTTGGRALFCNVNGCCFQDSLQTLGPTPLPFQIGQYIYTTLPLDKDESRLAVARDERKL